MELFCIAATLFLLFFTKKKTLYLVDQKTYHYLKVFSVSVLLVFIPFAAWIKVNMHTFSTQNILLILPGGFMLGEIIWRLIDKFVKTRAIRIYEE